MPPVSRSPKLACLATDPITARVLMAGQLGYLRQQGFDVTLITSPGTDLETTAQREGVRVIPVPMSREIAPFQDWKSLWQLQSVFRQLRPDIVNAGTPKAGLLGMLAAAWTRVPVRIYTLRGLRMETATGLKRALLTTTERVAAACAHQVICVSPSLRDAYISHHLGAPAKAIVLGGGSSNGIETERFLPTSERTAAALAIRKSMGIPDDARVIGFVGRLTRDKGVEELLSVFETLKPEFPDLHLMLVGGFEEGDPLSPPLRDQIRNHPQIHITGFVLDTAPYYPAFDLLVFPSHREGLPNTPLEAAAAGLPTVGFAVTGTVDAVQQGVTGTIVPPGNVAEMSHAVRRYLSDSALLTLHGANAQRRVQNEFRREVIWQQLSHLYNDELLSRGMPPATPQIRSDDTAVA